MEEAPCPVQQRWRREDAEAKEKNRTEHLRTLGKLVFFGSGIFMTPHFNASHTFAEMMHDWVFAGMSLGAAIYFFAQNNPLSVKRHLIAGVFAFLFLIFSGYFLLNSAESYTYNLFMHGQEDAS